MREDIFLDVSSPTAVKISRASTTAGGLLMGSGVTVVEGSNSSPRPNEEDIDLDTQQRQIQ
jgi:hypothetical protein